MAPSFLSRRQCNDAYDPSSTSCGNNDFWWSSTGMGVRYAIVALVFGALVVVLFISYLHAQRRLRKGLPPLAYHRWLVSRRQYPYPTQNQYQYYHHDSSQQGYPIHGYPQQYHNTQNAPPFQQPPPAYNQFDVPPVYQPPAGASKALPNQNIQSVNAGAGESSGSAVVAPPTEAHHP